VTGEEDRFVVAPAGSTQRWVVHRPIDPYGDGHVHTMLVEVGDEGLTAGGHSTFEGRTSENLRDFLAGLAKDWRGWQGARTWTSMEGEMTLEASHDGLGHVTIAVTLRRAERPGDPDAWSARIVLTLEAGEELHRLAAGTEHSLEIDK
jgi:uncharacterized protein DUF6228